MLLSGMLGAVLTLVAAQFMSLVLSTYMNASYAAFYCSVSKPGGAEDLLNAMRTKMREMGMSDEEIQKWVDYVVSEGVSKVRTQVGTITFVMNKTDRIKAFLRCFDKYRV